MDRFARVAATGFVALGVIALGGWLLGAPALERLAAGHTSLAITGVALLLAGAYAWWSARRVRAADAARTVSTAELATVELKYRNFFDESPVALYRTAPDGRILDANRSLAILLGYDSPGELLGVSATAHHAHAGAREAFRLVLDSQRVVRGHTVELRRRDGTTFWAVDTSAAVSGPDGKIRHYEGCLVDVTEAHTAEERVAASERRYRTLIEQSADGIALLDRAGTVLYTTPSSERMFGRPVADRIGGAFGEFIHPDDAEVARKAFVEAAITPGAMVRVTVRALHADGSWRWVETTLTNRLDDPDVAALVVNFRDVTALREAEERFVQTQRTEAVGRLAGGIAHDFNNLLTVIVATADHLAQTLGPGSEEAELVEDIRLAADSATAFTRQLLLFSRRQLVSPELQRLDTAVADAAALLRRLIGEDVRLVLALDAADAWINVDSGQLVQVLTNLAVNSRDAMPAGGTLTISTARRAGGVALVVRDTGTGMPPDVLARAFEPFFTTKSAGRGTGLGLATCQGIVRQAGGDIAIESEAGAGTTVVVTLPEAPAPPADAAAKAPAPRGTGEAILLVEDDAAVRQVARRALRNAGYHVVTARDGQEAVDVIRDAGVRIDLLLTDVVLPGIGGRAVAEAGRAARPGLRVLFTSGYTDDVILQRQLLAHDVTLLSKPFTQQQLATKVREVLDA